MRNGTKKNEKKSWIVTMRCVVIKEVIVNDCTKEEATENPWDYAQEETEREQEDWTVLTVEENA